MAVEIKMPQLSDTMHAGKILAWNKKEGEEVKRGDILAEVETDKANLEIESFHQGVLLKILVPAESDAKVGDVIAVIGQPNEAVAPNVANGGGSNGAAPAEPQSAKQHPSPTAESKGAMMPSPAAIVAAPSRVPTPPQEAPMHAAVTLQSQQLPQTKATPQTDDDEGESTFDHASGRIKASPLARKLAEQHRIDLGSLHGSGPNGRIVRRDVDAARSKGPASPAPSAARPQPSPAAPETRAPQSSQESGGKLTPFTKMRDTIARRMQESVTQAPHFYTTASVDMEEAMKLREILKERPEFKGISINHLVIKAAAYALQREPRVNRAVRQGMTYEPDSINIGIITAIEDGLLIPVVKEANTLSLKDLVFEARAAVERARAGRPTSSDLSGGTFSISNMGMFDVESFTAIINPGQGAVLAVSSIKQEPVVRGGQIVVGSRMRVTLSVDHRIIDGVMAGNFLKFFKEALEVPALMMA